jgi:hypothetical protein
MHARDAFFSLRFLRAIQIAAAAAPISDSLLNHGILFSEKWQQQIKSALDGSGVP